MNKKEFNMIKAERPEGRIGQRTFQYQNTRDTLAFVLNTGKKKRKLNKFDKGLEEVARINYLVEKTFSKETLNKQDYDFILGLSTEYLENFYSKIKEKVLMYRARIINMNEIHEDSPDEEDVNGFIAGNKILRFISQTKNDVPSEIIEINRNHTTLCFDKNDLKKWDDDMKEIYPNREEIVSNNKADAERKRSNLKESIKNTLKDEDRKEVFEKIYGNRVGVIKDLKENFVTINEDVEMFGHKGKKIKFELPAVGDFKGFKFESFISNDTVNVKDLGKAPEIEKQLYSMKEIGELLGALRKYMKEYGVELDGDGEVNYKDVLRCDKSRIYQTETGSCLNAILNLNEDYWMKDKYLLGQEYDKNIILKPHIILRCQGDRSFFMDSKDPLTLGGIRDIVEGKIWGYTSGFGGYNDAHLLVNLS